IKRFEVYYPPTGRYFIISGFEIGDNLFAVLRIDITENKLIDDALKESEEKFRTIFNSANDSIFLHEIFNEGVPGKFIEINKVASKTYGYTRDEFLNMTPKDIVSPNDKDKIHERGRKLIKDGYYTFEAVDITKEGNDILMEVNAHLIKLKGKNIVLSISRDITERKKMEESLKEAVASKSKILDELIQARDHLEEQVKERTEELEEAYDSLKESELKFKSLAENSPFAIRRLDKDFRYLYSNMGSSFFELPKEDFVCRTIDEIGVNKEFVKNWKVRGEKVFKTGEIQEEIDEIPTPGGIVTLKSLVVPEFNVKNEVESIIVITQDITAIKNTENKLKQLINELERSNHELQQFAYVSSHDLQEPLRTIASFTQLLERRYKGQLDEDADEFMDYIVDAAKRMKEQIHGLLEFSRVGTKGGEFKHVDMNLILNQTIQNLNVSIREANAEITHEELPTVMGDVNQLQRVFQNLISNAIKFRKPEEPPKIHISAYKSEDGKEYVFSVQDNGIGMEEQYFERIFTIFQQLHTRDEYEGTGIGLAIVKRIIERHGGRVWVESEFGKGSTFYFILPVESQK
ncbi:MAG: PAS domain-containing sensor histidine kinase, partial [Methanobacterium sp.]